MNPLEVIRRLEAAPDSAAWQRRELKLWPAGERLRVDARVCFWPAEDGRGSHGYWALAVVEGAYGGTPLDALNAVVFYGIPADSPLAGWSRALYIDRRALRSQRFVLERILSGGAGAEFAALERRVSRPLATHCVPLNFRRARGAEPDAAPGTAPRRPLVALPPCGRPPLPATGGR
jgi:Protein of unknown function (DUF1326)